ncbi:MAG: hypothetical protein KatS3mg020_0258 [Fimbriimonadales bacterium]|nr:MAG: hypothetical protein KatS3mg020_0258 [Fimbriimonadales bacterium]
MRFHTLAVEGYGRFGERAAFEFDAGLNIVHGANESGKSTLLAALLDALYTLPSSTAQTARERIHWGHPNGWTLELELELRGERVSIRKFHPVDDPRKRAEFTLRIGEETLSGDAARTRWEQIWQIPQEVYLATACVRQRELAQITNRNLKSLQQQLRISAVSADLNRILNALQQERRRLRVQTETQERAVQSVEARLRTIQHAERQRQSLRAQLQQLETEVAQLSPKLESDEQLLQRWRSLTAQQEQLERLRREADANQRHLDKLEQLERRIRELETELQRQSTDWDALPNDFKEQVDAAYLRYQDAARRLRMLSDSANRQRAERQQGRGRQQARLGFAVMGVALLIASAPLWGISPVLGGAALAIGTGHARRRTALAWATAN